MHYFLIHLSRRQLSLGLALVMMLVAVITPQAQPAEAALSLPTNFQSESIVGNLSLPTAIAWAPDKRMFIAQKNGIVRVVPDGTVVNSTPLATPFIDLSAEVNTSTDRGLLGIAVDPQFPTRPYVYLLYSYDPPGLTGTGTASNAPDGNGSRVARLIRVEADGSSGKNYNVAKVNTTVVLLGTNSTYANSGDVTSQTGAPACMTGGSTPTPIQDCLPSDYDSHSIGTVRFADDGSLFVSIGDGSTNSSSGDNRSFRAQNIDSLSGKIMRINPDTGQGYSDNPFYNGDPTSNRSKVWSYGLRNPFRFTIKPGTNEVYLGDVELATWEEINTGKGKNFGWPCYEGGDTGNLPLILYQNNPQCTQLYSQPAGTVQAPLYAYQHPDHGSYKDQRAIIGGDFYTGTSYPAAYRNALFFADYAADDMSYMTIDGSGNATVNTFGTDFQTLGNGGIVQIIAGPDTNLYYVLLTAEGPTSGQVRRLTYTVGNARPVAQASATPTNGTTPLTVNFSAAGSADPNGDALTYTWTFGDGGNAAGINVAHTYTTSGVFSAVLTVSDGSLADTKTFTINVGNTAPTAIIDTPLLGTKFNGGDSFTLTGHGTDNEDGSINTNTQLHWSFVFHHNEHTHPNAFPDVNSKTATIIIPNNHGNNFWVEACLTVTDSKGLDSTPTCQQYYPNTTPYTFQTDPPGLTLSRGEGFASATPFTEPLVVNGIYGVVAPQVQQHRSFDHWQDGNTESDRTLLGGVTPQTFTATYINKPPVAMPGLVSSNPTTQAPITFSNASFDPEDLTTGLSYKWNFDDNTTSTDSAPTHTYARPGTYTVTLTVTDVLGATNSKTITVGLPNQLPTAGMTVSIDSSAAATTYRVGQTLNLHSTATDPDGTLGDSNIKWEIIRYHDGVSETLAMLSGLSATFKVPDTSAKATAAMNPLLQRALSDPSTESIDVRQTVIDNNGGSATTTTKLTPQLVNVSVAATPAGLAVQLNGERSATSLTRTFIAGATVTLSAETSQIFNGTTYTFNGWSDKGMSEHTVVTDTTATYTATYVTGEQGGMQPVLWLPLTVR